MRQIFVVFCLLTCLMIPNSVADSSNQDNWEVDLDNGYISTKPIFVDDQVIVRTSGFWTGEDRPHVYSFDVQSGIENWRFSNPNSTNHDMSPLLQLNCGKSTLRFSVPSLKQNLDNPCLVGTTRFSPSCAIAPVIPQVTTSVFDDQIKPPSSEFKAVTLPSVHATKIMSDQVPHSPCPALMGLVMKECGGAADGKQVSALLREEIMRHV